MSFSKISSITLYVVAAISIVVILFFYVGPVTVDMDALDAKVEALTTGGDEAEEAMTGDTTAMDTAQIAGEMAAQDSLPANDSATMAQAPVVPEEPAATVGEVDLKDHLSTWELMVYKRTDYALGWAYILVLITLIAAVIFPLINIVTDVKAILRTLAVFGVAAVLILISYFIFASDTPISILGYTGTSNSDPVTLKWIDTGLFSTYILFGLAILSILYSEVANIFK